MASSQTMRVLTALCGAGTRSASVFLRDTGRGLLDVTHNTFALLGLAIAIVAAFAVGRPDLRHEAELQAFTWLQARLPGSVVAAPVAARPEPAPVVVLARESRAPVPAATAPSEVAPEPQARNAAVDLKDLSRPQAAVATWLARRYKVAPEPVGALVREAWQIGQKSGLDPTLILAIMAVESSFNPFAQSAVGAQGLMQVMTKVHNAKYVAFGGNRAAFDPVTNLRVGVEVLKECISRSGSLEGGLRSYVGAGNQAEDGGYAGKVLSEQNSLKMVVGGKSVPPTRTSAVNLNAPAKSVPVEPAPAAATDDAHPRPLEQIALLH